MMTFNLLNLAAVAHLSLLQCGLKKNVGVWPVVSALPWAELMEALALSVDCTSCCSRFKCFETLHKSKRMIVSFSYLVEFGVCSKHKSYIPRFAGESPLCGCSSGGLHSTVFEFSVESESIPFLSPDFVYLAGNMCGGLNSELLQAVLFVSL